MGLFLLREFLQRHGKYKKKMIFSLILILNEQALTRYANIWSITNNVFGLQFWPEVRPTSDFQYWWIWSLDSDHRWYHKIIALLSLMIMSSIIYINLCCNILLRKWEQVQCILHNWHITLGCFKILLLWSWDLYTSHLIYTTLVIIPSY